MGLFDNKEENKYEEVVQEETVDAVDDFQEDQITEIAFISASTKIDGNITTQGHLILKGDVEGNTSAKGNLVLYGTTKGDIKCDSLLINDACTSSNVQAENNVIIKKETVFNGNITCKNITVWGTVHGDISAKGSVVLKSTAVINGNVVAERIGIESGAKISGNVNIK